MGTHQLMGAQKDLKEFLRNRSIYLQVDFYLHMYTKSIEYVLLVLTKSTILIASMTSFRVLN
jgi:hypothetical protein